MNGAGAGPLIEALLNSAAFPFQYDAAAGQVLLVALPADALAGAAFLDQRLLTPSLGRSAVAIADFETAAEALPPRLPNMIFHQGHCGSTLLSRLVAAATGSRALREPLVLRALAALMADVAAGDAALTPADAERRLRLFLRCLAQGDIPAVVKGSSICTDLAEPLLGSDPDFRALFLYVQPEVYLATMLAGPNNRIDLTAFGGLRRKRLRNRGIETEPPFDLSDGQLAALAWACEAVGFHSCPDDGRLMAIDFDLFLASPVTTLIAAARHFRLETDGAAVAAAIDGPDMRTYSKAQEHQYSPALRMEVLTLARREHASQIAAGLEWLARLAARHESVRAVMRRLSAPGASQASPA